MSLVPVEYIVARYFVKYNRLDAIIPVSFQGSKASSVNIFIDLYGLYKTLFSRSYRTDISDYTAFTTTVIDMCAHYRSYFKSLRVKTTFYIISSYNVPEINCRYVAGYNKTFQDKLKNKQVEEMITINTQLLELLCPFLPDIHFFKTSFESTVMMDHIIRTGLSNGSEPVPNIILSSDLYPLQLCSTYNDTVLLRPRKINGEDISTITCPKGHPLYLDSFWSMVCADRDNLMSDKSRVLINPSNYMLLMAMNRFPERNLQNIISFNLANKIIYDIIGDHDVVIDVETAFNSDPTLYDKYPREIINSRYKTLNVFYQTTMFSESIESKTIRCDNLWDPDAIQTINNKYFQTNPIDVFRL